MRTSRSGRFRTRARHCPFLTSSAVTHPRTPISPPLLRRAPCLSPRAAPWCGFAAVDVTERATPARLARRASTAIVRLSSVL